MIAFIDDHRDVHGVEPICEVLPIAPSTYRAHAAARRYPEKSSARAKRDAGLREKIRRVYDENFQVYGARKIWRQLNREGESVARCTVERLMRGMGLQGAVRGKPVKTTVSDKAAPCPRDKVGSNSRRRGRTRCGCPTSPMSRLGPASSMSPSSSTPSQGGSSAGAPRARRMRGSCRRARAGVVRPLTRSRRRPRASQRPRRAGRFNRSSQ